MSIVATCTQTAEVIRHARSLFGDNPSSAPDNSQRLRESAHETTAARGRTVELSGTTVTAYRKLNRRAASDLTFAAHSDLQVGTHVDHAAVAVRHGAAQLAAIAEENNATITAARYARTPAQEAVILRALRSQVSRTQQIVADTTKQASGLSTGIQAVDYRTSPPPQPPAPPPSPLQEAPAPLHDFTEHQLAGQQVPGWQPPPPPVSGDPIRLPSAPPKAPTVINMDTTPAPVDLFPNCDNGDVVKAFGQVAGGGIGAAIATTTGPLTAGVTWAGIAAAAVPIAEGVDNLKNCKGLS
jgi:hypothetical protein